VVLQYGLQIDGELLSRTDLHIHFPAGAVGKDGPSAGVTIAAALISLFSERPIATDVAMTGEITLRGVVLPVSSSLNSAFLHNESVGKQDCLQSGWPGFTLV
jgi:ATP-dependent Lon protease